MNEDDIMNFLSNDLGIETSDLDSDSPLFSSGIVDSFALVELMIIIESKCGFRMSPTDVNLDNLDTVNRIVSYCERMAAA